MLCMIPARAGSKRLASKNMLMLNGQHMIAYSIQAALKCGLFKSVYVCTEDADIADVAKAYGAKVPFIVPEKLCGDLVPSHIPCQHVSEHIGGAESIICLQPTSPLRSAEDICGAVDKFYKDKLDFLVSITQIDPHNFHWAVSNSGDEWKMFFGDKYMVERPLLPEVYRPNGSIKIARLDALSRVGHFFGDNMGVYKTPEERSVHVSTWFDFDMCQFLLRSDR